MIKTAIVHNWKPYPDLNQLKEVGNECGFDAYLVHVNDYDQSAQLVINRLSPHADRDQLFTLDHGVPVVNSIESYLLCRDKLLTFTKLKELGYPTPNTSPINEPIVIKPRNGSLGKGVVLVDDSYIIQEYISESRYQDVRVFVIGDEIFCSKRRYTEDKNADIVKHVNDKEEFIKLPDHIETMCINVVSDFGLDYTGMDLLFGPNGTFYICELNAAPAQFNSFNKWVDVSDPNISEKLYSWIKQEYF